MKKFEETKTSEVLNLINESMEEVLDMTGEIPTLYVENIAEELAYRENTKYDDYYLVQVEKAFDELQSLGYVQVNEYNKVTVL
nr:MAG TPA: hypothetical protein [Caudoviricetes sp.]